MSAGETKAFRVAVRGHKDGVVRAWLSRPDTMEGAVCIASISQAVCDADEAVFDKFKELCRAAAVAVSIETFGVAPLRFEEISVPPEKGGAA
jgi:hypothetical protein